MRSKFYPSFIVTAIFCLIAFTSIAQTNADSLLNFIAKNALRSSLCLSKNDSTIVDYNDDRLMPLGGTSYIMIAIEFAKQASSGIIDEDSLVSLKDINHYYLPTTADSAAQTAWLTYESNANHLINDSIQLGNIARGMMMYNCNANAEYLLDVLGIDNVKNNNQLFGLTKHTAIFPPVASMFLYQNPKKLKEKEVLNGIKSLSDEQYCKIIYEIHKALEYDTLLKPKFSAKEFDLKMQKLWSSRLTESNAKEYVQICKILNNRKFLSSNSFDVVAEIIETAMESPDKINWLLHECVKEGRTPWLLTRIIYATEKDGTKIDMAYFFNDLTPEENKTISRWTNDFENSILKDETFRQKIMKTLN